MTHIIYFDAYDHQRTGYGWKVIEGGSLALRFGTMQRAITECQENEWPWVLLSANVTPDEAVCAMEYAFQMRGVG